LNGKDGANLKDHRNAMIEQIPCARLSALDNRVMRPAILHLKKTQNEKGPPTTNPSVNCSGRASRSEAVFVSVGQAMPGRPANIEVSKAS
jgi:hypothetical protein